MDQPSHTQKGTQKAFAATASEVGGEGRAHGGFTASSLTLTSLVGRKDELEQILSLLASGEARLLTLTGPGGVGKTRLALQVGIRSDSIFRDGAYFVPLAAISDPDMVLPVIAQTLGVQETADKPLLGALCTALERKHILLILDNFEQITAAAPKIMDLLACASRLSLLVTSRATLHVYGGREYPVPPLRLPNASGHEPVEQLSQYEAVRLFIERARTARPGFSITNRNAPAVAEICHRLDGLPLAIELAAARTRLLSPQALLQRLDRRLPILTGGGENLPRRHQTLRNAIAWSYDLLTEAEKAQLRCLSVFVRGFSLEAATAVCSQPGAENNAPADARERTQLESLQAISEKSLLRDEEQEDGEPRFSMLETIREFALDELSATGEEQDVRERHARFFVQLAERGERELWGGDQALWYGKLELEHDNLRTALLYARQRANAELGLRIAVSLVRFWHVRGHMNEGRKWLSDALERGVESAPDLRIKAYNGLGIFAGAQSDYEGARHYHSLALELSRETGDRAGMARALSNLGNGARLVGNHARAMSTFGEALKIHRELGHKHGIAMTLRNMGIIASSLGEPEMEERYSQEALGVYREMEEKQGIATTLSGLGVMALSRGDYGRARAYSEECLSLFRELGNSGGQAGALHDLGEIAAAEGDKATARTLMLESLRIRHEQGMKRGVAQSLRDLAMLDGGDERTDFGRLVRLIAASQAITGDIGAPIPERDRKSMEEALEQARRVLNPEEFGKAETEGRAMTIARAVEVAMQGPPSNSERNTANPAAPSRAAASPQQESDLTPREAEVLRLVAVGLTNAGIASHMHVSINTVQTHVRSVFSKINVSSRSAAVRYAFEHGLS